MVTIEKKGNGCLFSLVFQSAKVGNRVHVVTSVLHFKEHKSHKYVNTKIKILINKVEVLIVTKKITTYILQELYYLNFILVILETQPTHF